MVAWLCFFGGVVVFLWCGGVFLVVFLWWCGCVSVVVFFLRSVGGECCREVLGRCVVEKCWRRAL